MAEPESAIHNYELRGAVAQLATWIQNSEGKSRESNGGVPIEVMISGQAGTGKSFGICLVLLWVARNWQGSRILIVRKTRKSMTQSVLTTLERILGPESQVIGNQSKENRSSYWIGKSEIALGTMENPDAHYSTEWDIVWLEEARQIPEGAYLKFMRSLRHFRTPFSLILSSTNPDSPALYLYQRWKTERHIHGLVSFHQDNPQYYKNGQWTEEGTIYRTTLSRLKGNDYKRLYLGLWVAAEGAVWPDYDPAVHDCTITRGVDGFITPEAIREMKMWEFYAGYDWGWDHPGALIVAGMDESGHLWTVAQVLRRQKQPEWWADTLVELHHHYPIELCFCEHRPDIIEMFNEKLGVPKDGPGAIAVKAEKDVDVGIAIMRARFQNRTIHFERNSVYGGEDDWLRNHGKPTRIEKEIVGYRYKREGLEDENDTRTRKEQVEKIDDDLCDSLRYLGVGVHSFDAPTERKARKTVIIKPGSLGALFHADDPELEPIDENHGVTLYA